MTPMLLDGPTEALHGFAIAHGWLTLPVIVATAACIALCPVALVLTWARTRRLRSAVATLLGLAVADKVCHAIESSQYTPRPFVAFDFTPLFPHTANTSFPSSTVAYATVVAIVVLLAWRSHGIALALGTVMIAFGCVYVGVHYVSDVVVGAVIGVACGATMWFALGWDGATRFLATIEERLPGTRTSRG
jgi:undecaprenyl-diphosphatase